MRYYRLYFFTQRMYFLISEHFLDHFFHLLKPSITDQYQASTRGSQLQLPSRMCLVSMMVMMVMSEKLMGKET